MNDFIAMIVVHSIVSADHIRLGEIALGQVRVHHAGDKDSPGGGIWCALMHSSMMINPAVFAKFVLNGSPALPFSRSVRSLFGLT